MALNKQKRSVRRFCGKGPTEGQDSGNVCLTRRNHARVLFDDIVKPQLQFRVLTKPAECFRNWVVWIQDRQNMARTGLAVPSEFFDATDGDPERYDARHVCHVL